VKRRPVWIRWHDAAHVAPGEWVDNLADTGVTVHTVGVLIGKTKTHLVIAHSVDSSGNCTGVFSIPRTAVEDWHELHD
jgi:hypothetical protein